MTLVRLFVSIALLGAIACDTETPTTVVVDNDYPVVADGGNPATQMSVFKVWWVTSLLPDAVGPGGEGQSQRTVAGTDFAYALLAPGWDVSSSTPPSRFLVARSTVKLSAVRGETLHIHVAAETFLGDCGAGKPLSQEDTDLITQRIFPDELGGTVYEARTCGSKPILSEGGADQTSDGAQAASGASVGAQQEGGDAKVE